MSNEKDVYKLDADLTKWVCECIFGSLCETF